MLYDDQATTFDDRAGIPSEAVTSIADALFGIANPHEGDRWLEIGAGTGLLSIAILERPIVYTGFDRSPEMIRVFHRRLAASGARARLFVSDGNEQWPVDDQSVDVIFSSRALHHLSVDHAVEEIMRVLAEHGGWLLTGNIERPRDSVRSTMRREMRSRLGAMGFEGRSHGRHARALFDMLVDKGGREMAPVTAATWVRMVSPADSLVDWEGKSGLAGVELQAERKTALLADLYRWAATKYGDPQQPIEQEERYQIEGVYFGAR